MDRSTAVRLRIPEILIIHWFSWNALIQSGTEQYGMVNTVKYTTYRIKPAASPDFGSMH